MLLKTNNIQYQCANQSCLPSIIIYTSSLIQCQLACTNNLQCRTVTYDPSNKRCEMFADMPDQNGNLVAQGGIITMIAIDSRKLSACE